MDFVPVQQWLELFLQHICLSGNQQENDSLYFKSLFSEISQLPGKKTQMISTLFYTIPPSDKTDQTNLQSLCDDFPSLPTRHCEKQQSTTELSSSRVIEKLPAVLVFSIESKEALLFPIQNLSIITT